MPTGVAIRDARAQLFDAAERILLRDGPSGLTSRSVTAEAGCAKGVLHRHFADFDGFLAELIEDRIARVEQLGTALRERAGSASVAGNLTEALTEVFETVAVAIVSLVTFRDELRARLRQRRPVGIPILGEATTSIAQYLAAEVATGRVAPSADTGILSATLIGSAHLLFADRTAARPETGAVHAMVTTVLGGALTP
ncbi:TetR/AcrR family transcriptional regulator [Nocardia yunnanensis]|uniref:TetR/AcrR family transcriptional regulator n=1 Tax=Nocardia yunnanensis TaxID=2382165 RepID=A0A386ZD17_9NOCA|nr:TetR/AcrR family transcriptional regulator [Nocardia yunnanensis]AYF74525.1 TetR/AcrR family transcriptional regulator [Nocardia yunnanensis]